MSTNAGPPAALEPVAGRDASRPLPFVRAARAVFELSLEGMVWSRRSVLMALLLGLPLLFAVAYRAVPAAGLSAKLSGLDLYAVIIAIYYVRNVLPLTALFYGSSLIADEVEARTLTYLLTRPIRRSAILAGKFAAYLVTSLTFVWPVIVLSFFLLATARGRAGVGGLVPTLFQDLGVAALTLLAYGGLFTLLGVLSKRPVIPGLLFLFGWELLANLPGYLPRLTLTAWLRSLLGHRPAQEGVGDLFAQLLPAGQSLLALGLSSAAFLCLAFWIFSEREYVMEQ